MIDTDQENERKSAKLAYMCGWEISQRNNPVTGAVRFRPPKAQSVHWCNNLYKPGNMLLLARVIEWACKNMDSIHGMDPNIYFDTFFNPADFHGSMMRMADDILAEAA